MFTTILLIANVILTAIVLALKVIAPLTKTTVDDKILIYAEDAEKVLEGLGGAKAADAQGIKVLPAANPTA